VETIDNGVQERLHSDRIVQAQLGSHPEQFKTPSEEQAARLEARIEQDTGTLVLLLLIAETLKLWKCACD
jgi:hypothetical protein